jgi:hypothetical protein
VDWGQAHLAVVQPPFGSGGAVASAMAPADTLRRAFCFNPQGVAGVVDDLSGPRAASKDWPALAVQLDLSLPSSSSASSSASFKSATGTALLALDLGNSLRYFGTDLAPFWKATNSGSSGNSAESVAAVSALEMLSTAATQAPAVLAAAHIFDAQLASEHTAKGGGSFATLTSLVYRQVTGSLEKARDPLTGDPWLFMKEISSDGDVSTVRCVWAAPEHHAGTFTVSFSLFLSLFELS